MTVFPKFVIAPKVIVPAITFDVTLNSPLDKLESKVEVLTESSFSFPIRTSIVVPLPTRLETLVSSSAVKV